MFKPRQLCFGLLAGLLSVGLAQATDRPLRMVDEGGADKDWMPAGNLPLVQAPYPKVGGIREDVCVSIGYRINRDGSTSDLSMLKAWSTSNPGAEPSAESVSGFVQSAAAAVSLWRFEAKPGASSNRVVYTSASIAFAGDKGTAPEALREHCRVVDLKSFIANAQEAARRRGDLGRAELDRMNRTNSPIEQAARDRASRRSP